MASKTQRRARCKARRRNYSIHGFTTGRWGRKIQLARRKGYYLERLYRITRAHLPGPLTAKQRRAYNQCHNQIRRAARLRIKEMCARGVLPWSAYYSLIMKRLPLK